MITQGDHRRKQRPKEQMARRAPTADSRVSGASESSQPIPVTGRTPTMLSALSDIAPRDLHFGLPDDRADSEAQHVIITEAGGVLDRLRQLSDKLGKKYAWEPAQASVFVLTGRAPLLAPIRAQAEWHGRAAPAPDRVVIIIDPAIYRKDVAAPYMAKSKHE